MSFPRLACAAAALLAGCAAVPQQPQEPAAAALQERVAAILDSRGLGADALSVIDNMLRHEAPAPPYAPPLVRELLAAPLAAVGAAAIFDRAVSASLQRLVEEATAMKAPIPGPTVAIRDLLTVYLGELAEAQRVLRAANRGAAIDAGATLSRLRVHLLPPAAQFGAEAQALDAAALRRATDLFIGATARFVDLLRASAGRIRFPDRPERFDSPVGLVSIGSAGDDEHGPEATVIIDPGGHDQYRRAPSIGGAVSVIVDLGGDDSYEGSDIAVHGLSAIVDFSGNDRYRMAGPGIAAAYVGASLLLEFSGDDLYEADLFGEGAAALGFAALVDLRGDDRYRLRAGGQGFGALGGVGLLWDRDGNDRYAAAGLPDPLERGGGVSMAQGAGYGLRTRYGGGTGILRDDAGDDHYEAQMFAQGVAYWYGAGLLWDRAGADRYRAIRYAQGSGVHSAVGMLRDETGNDRYELVVGVGQGMGLDLSVGVLFDGAGDDRYQAPVLAQGSATANGLGLLIDAGGTDRWQLGTGALGWGSAQWLRSLPSIGLLLHAPAGAEFERAGRVEPAAPASAALGGPQGGAPVEHERPIAPNCAAVDPGLRQRAARQLRASIAELPGGDFDSAYALSEALRCALVQASPEDALSLWTDMEGLLGEKPATPFSGALVNALRDRPPPAPQLARILRVLDADARCGARAAALAIGETADAGADARAVLAPAAQAALRSSCWRLQSQGLAVLKRFGAAPDPAHRLPSFLQGGR